MNEQCQYIIIVIIGIITLLILSRKLYAFFTKKEKANPCANCAGCLLQKIKK